MILISKNIATTFFIVCILFVFVTPSTILVGEIN